MYYKPKHFKVGELVHPKIFKRWGEQALMFLDPGMLIALDGLRDMFGSTTCNNWLWGGSRVDSGLRLFNSGTGASFSAHKFGKAFDLVFKSVTAAQVRSYLKINFDCHEYRAITRIEKSMEGKPISWLHIDSFNVKPDPETRIVFMKV